MGDPAQHMYNVYQDTTIRHTVSVYRSKLLELKAIHNKENPDDIELINIARLLRDLLISDNNGLIGELSKVVPGFRRKKNNVLMFDAEIKVDTYHERVGPNRYDFKSKIVIPNSTGSKRYKRDVFLSLPIIEIDNDFGKIVFSIRHMIKFFSNKLGGTHLDFKRTHDPQIYYMIYGS